MINYIKMDLYKLFKSKAMLICLLIFTYLLFMSVTEVNDIEDVSELNTSGIVMETEGEDDYVSTGITMNPELIAGEGITLGSWMYSIYNGNLMMQILVIIMTIFVCNDYSGGFIKNTINIPKKRWYINVSKLISGLVVFIMLNIISILTYLVSYLFVFKNSELGNITDVLIYILLEMIIYIGITALIIFVCNITRSKAVGIVVGFLLSIQLISMLVVDFLDYFLGVGINTGMKLMMSSMAALLYPGMGAELIKEAAIVGVIGIVVWTILANLSITKQDV